jgi:hypothetical protein
MKVVRSYPTLEFIAGLYKFLAVIAAILGVIVAFIGRGPESFSGIVGGAIGCVTFLAASEVLKLFINIEENTRRTANLLEKEDVKETTKEEIKIEPPTTSPYQPPESKIQA